MTTPGSPENVKPATSNGHSLPTVVQCRPIWYQMPGTDDARGAGRWPGSACRSWSGRRRPPRSCEPMPSPPSPAPSRASAASRAASRPTCAQRRVAAGCQRRPATALRVPPVRGVLLEDPVDHARPGRRSAGAGRRGTPGTARRSRPACGSRDIRPRVDLVLHVAAQVPRHRLEPGHRVDRRPVLDRVVEAGAARAGCTPARSAPGRGRAR